MPISKLGQRRQVVIPKDICEELGLEVGDFVELRQVNGTVVIKPKKMVDRDEALTAEQRAVIDAGLAEAQEDIKAGRMSDSFGTVDELKRHLNAVKE